MDQVDEVNQRWRSDEQYHNTTLRTVEPSTRAQVKVSKLANVRISFTYRRDRLLPRSKFYEKDSCGVL